MEEKLSRNEIQDVVDFAAGILAADNFYSPWLSNQLLQNLNNNPRLPTADAVKKATNKTSYLSQDQSKR